MIEVFPTPAAPSITILINWEGGGGRGGGRWPLRGGGASPEEEEGARRPPWQQLQVPAPPPPCCPPHPSHGPGSHPLTTTTEMKHTMCYYTLESSKLIIHNYGHKFWNLNCNLLLPWEQDLPGILLSRYCRWQVAVSWARSPGQGHAVQTCNSSRL